MASKMIDACKSKFCVRFAWRRFKYPLTPRPGAKEKELMRGFLDREETATSYFAERKGVLAEMAEELQKQEDQRMQAENAAEGGLEASEAEIEIWAHYSS